MGRIAGVRTKVEINAVTANNKESKFQECQTAKLKISQLGIRLLIRKSTLNR